MKISEDLMPMYDIACRSDSTLLITGPTGCGKTSIAQRIHDQSKRRQKPFVTVNLATLHEGTLESELFGHERGAFTGASAKRVGRLEMAQGGTVFLDEIGELTPRLQARLLDFLQSKTVSALGSNRQQKLDVRIIAATHRDLEKASLRGEFRQDLYHRLRVLNFRLKPLVERAEEFGQIINDCLSDLARSEGKPILGMTDEAASALESHDWPGNIRELRNVLEFAVICARGSRITLMDLPPWFAPSPRGESVDLRESERVIGALEVPLTMNYHATIARFEKSYLERALAMNRGRVTRTAKALGLSKATLTRRLREFRMSKGLDDAIGQFDLKKNLVF